MERRIEFEVSADEWLTMMWPGHAETISAAPGFRCTYAIRETERGQQYYELHTEDGRTNWNDLSNFEKSCLWGCQDYFDNRLQVVGCPDYCMAMRTSDGMQFSYPEAIRR